LGNKAQEKAAWFICKGNACIYANAEQKILLNFLPLDFSTLHLQSSSHLALNLNLFIRKYII